MKQLYFTVTNDLSYDQRMHRICTTLSKIGYNVTLVGRALRTSIPLEEKDFQQKRLRCFFNKGFLFYSEYNIRLFFFLLSKKMDGVCAIDLDTILPCLAISGIKKVVRIYDAHEFFTEMKEVHSRPLVKKVWTAIERFAVPKFRHGYTVSEGLAEEFLQRYNWKYEVIRNLPVLRPINYQPTGDYIFYQGAVNEGRGFEFLVPAMKKINHPLIVCGDGNFMEKLRSLVMVHEVAHKIELKGMMLPGEIWPIAQKAILGMALSEKEGLNQLLALPNKFFDYLHAGIPQIAMDFPEYRKINEQYKVAILLEDLSVTAIAKAVNETAGNHELLQTLRANCLKARKVFCWQEEEKKLVLYYQQIFGIA